LCIHEDDDPDDDDDDEMILQLVYSISLPTFLNQACPKITKPMKALSAIEMICFLSLQHSGPGNSVVCGQHDFNSMTFFLLELLYSENAVEHVAHGK